jgi:hypothetical protein
VDGPPEIPPETLILKIPRDAASEEQELKFELDFLLSLTTQARFDLMFERSRQITGVLETHGHRAPTSIVKRS